MRHSFVFRAAAMLVIGTVPLLADFSYDQTSQITGGAMLKVIHVAGAFSKKTRQMTEPMLSTISIKGNRMVRKSADQATIIDLDQQTITTVHFTDKTYSVVTFEQLKQQMAAAAEKMKSRDNQPQQGDMSFDVKVSDTGQTKVINGNNTHEMMMVMTMTASSTDPKDKGQGALNMVNHVWIAPNVSGYGEVRDFHRRMAETLGWVPGENPLISRPDMAKAMGQAYKEASKLDGMPLLTTVRMGATVQGTPDSSAQAQQPDQSSQQQSAAAPPPTSVGDALSGALAGRFGLGRHKKHADSAPANQDPPVQKVSSQQSDQPQQSEASLMEMTSQVTSYNSAAVDPAVFAVPSDFEKVEQDLANPRRRR